MSGLVTIRDDVKTAAVLAGAFAVVAAISIPFLLPSMLEMAPPEQRSLPAPLPLLCVVQALLLLIVYGLFALAGLRMARSRHLHPAPLLSALWRRQRPDRIWSPAGVAFGAGLVCGIVLLGTVAIIKRFLPHTLPEVLHPPGIWAALLASGAGSIGEEILSRLFLLSALLRILPASRASTVIAVVVGALLFGALHAPGAIFICGGFENVPHLFWVWIIVLNGFVGIVCSIFFIRIGIGGAILAHFGTDLVWHVVSQLF